MTPLVMLVVDDDVAFTTLLTELLRGDDCTIEHAANGREALAVLDRMKPHLILTDLVMPVMDGWQLIRALRKDSRFGGVPIVVMSAVAKKVVPEGAACCVDKNALLGKIGELLMTVDDAPT